MTIRSQPNNSEKVTKNSAKKTHILTVTRMTAVHMAIHTMIHILIHTHTHTRTHILTIIRIHTVMADVDLSKMKKKFSASDTFSYK